MSLVLFSLILVVHLRRLPLVKKESKELDWLSRYEQREIEMNFGILRAFREIKTRSTKFRRLFFIILVANINRRRLSGQTNSCTVVSDGLRSTNGQKKCDYPTTVFHLSLLVDYSKRQRFITFLFTIREKRM